MILAILTVFIQHAISASIPDIVLNIRDGPVRGQLFVTDNYKFYFGFRGIPYAKPPIGNLRFEEPQPPDPWSDVWNATEDSKACISNLYIFNQDNEREDCLYINVYTPSIITRDGLPVMFWIYGGDFVSGNATKESYGPDFIMEEDVILVTFNYRLGPFGFLSTGDEIMPGNYGLKDQNLALRWTQENIAYFGGDPEKVTIFGQSAGAVSVSLHILSSKSKDLFRAAIIESASALVPWSINTDPKWYASKLAANAGYNGNDSAGIKSFLMEKSPAEIVLSTDWIKLDWPVLEVKHDTAFITESNYMLLESGKFNQVPIIIGICSEESLGFLIDPFIARMEALVFDLTPSLLIPPNLRSNDSDTDVVISRIKSMYIEQNETFFENVGSYAEYITDTMFTRGILKQAQLQSLYTPVYLYQFSYYGRPLIPAFIEGVGKAGHAAEIPFIFNLANFNWNDTDTQNVLVQDRVVKMWTNFAKYLAPTPERVDLLNNITWYKLYPPILNYLNINETLEIKFHLRQTIYTKWNEIYEEFGQKPFITY